MRGMDINRKALLGFLAVALIVLFVLNRVANGFLPDARLFPFVMTAVGCVLGLAALGRVLLRQEPIQDSSLGKGDDETLEKQRHAYLEAAFYLVLISGFYLGIWLVGFRLAALLFTFGFMKHFGQSTRHALSYALAGLVLIEVLSRLLQLVLPGGFWYLLGF